jgi:uncharacterized membrane protein
MNQTGGQPNLRLPPVSAIRALWFGVVLLVAVGLASVIGRGVFTPDFATRADPVRQQIFAALHREDPLASQRPEELDRFDGRFGADPFVTMLHILPGGLLMILAPLQFSSRIRNRNIRFHRWSGRLLVGAAIVSAVAGLYFGLLVPYGGFGEAAATALFGGILLVSVILAVVAIRRGQVARHREWMIRAFAIVLGISMVRVVGTAFDVVLTPAGLPPPELFVLSLWTGWSLTLAAGELWIRYTRGAGERLIASDLMGGGVHP